MTLSRAVQEKLAVTGSESAEGHTITTVQFTGSMMVAAVTDTYNIIYEILGRIILTGSEIYINYQILIMSL